MNRKTRPWKAASGLALLVFAAFGAAAAAQETERKGVAVRHPNLLLNQQEPSKELRVHLVQGSGRSSYTFVRAKFLPGEVEDPWAVQFLDDQGRKVAHFVWDSLTWQEAREGPTQWGGQGRYALLNHAAGDVPGVFEARNRRIEWAEKNIPEIGARLRAQEKAARQHGGSVCAALYLLKYRWSPSARPA